MKPGLAVLAVTALGGTAQAEPPKTIALADLGLHVIGAGMQHTVGEHVAVQGALEFYSPWTQNLDTLGLRDDTVEGDVTGAAIRIRAFGYLGAAPTGWWVSPFGQIGAARATRDGAKRTGLVWAVGLAAGYAWILGSHLHIAVGGGVQYDVARIPGGDSTPSFATIYPHLDANLGYAF